jgi:hypothetical protein
MYELTSADLIWNRACEGGGPNPSRGDSALAALLSAHGLTMNGGVLHAVECLTPSELSDAKAGYCFFGLDSVADLMSRARRILEANADLETQESLLDEEYGKLIPDDASIAERFEKRLKANPSDFAAL